VPALEAPLRRGGRPLTHHLSSLCSCGFLPALTEKGKGGAVFACEGRLRDELRQWALVATIPPLRGRVRAACLRQAGANVRKAGHSGRDDRAREINQFSAHHTATFARGPVFNRPEHGGCAVEPLYS